MDVATRHQLQTFAAKAGCVHSQRKAHDLWNKVKDFLTRDEQAAIQVAWNHHILGEGRKELDKVVEAICQGQYL